METLLSALRHRHLSLDAEIDREQRRRTADHVRISAMKRVRLRIRDEISRLEAAQRTDGLSLRASA